MRVISQAAYIYAAGGFTTFVDGIVGPWMLHHFRGFSQAGDRPCLQYVVLRPSRGETLRRAQGRVAAAALVDEEPIGSLWDQFADLETLESHVIDTTEQAPADTSLSVADAITSDRFLLDVARTSSLS